MALYGLAIIPLIKFLSVDDVTQKWYADDGNAVGKLSNLRTVLDKIVSLGKFFGYHVKASKCQLIAKDEKLGEAQKTFANTGITIKAGARVLGSVIGTESECKSILEFQQNEQIKNLKKLTKVAKTSPQNVYACYTKGVQIAEKLATEEQNPELMELYNACRLTPLDKNPGVRPIGIGEVMRRIIGRTKTKCLKKELTSLGSNYQLCLGQKYGIEYAIHTLRDQYSKTSADAVLLIEAKNAFNSLNRKLALKNIENTCPSLLTAIKNSNSNPFKLFVNKKKQSTLKEGQPRGIH